MIYEGDEAPEFTVEDTAGRERTLSETLDTPHRGGDIGPTVVLLNRGAWCSYCAEQLRTFSWMAEDLWQNYNVDILSVSGDPLPELRAMRDRNGLGFQPCSDPDLDVASAYTGIDENPRHGDVAIPGTFVVDPNGIVQYAHHAEHTGDRTYGNHVRYFIRYEYDYEPSSHYRQE